MDLARQTKHNEKDIRYWQHKYYLEKLRNILYQVEDIGYQTENKTVLSKTTNVYQNIYNLYKEMGGYEKENTEKK